MRNKIAVIVLVVLVATAGVLFGRRILNNNHDTVTLQVRNLPLAEVAGKIYSQTGTKVNVDPKLDAKISLDVKDMPLPKVLDMLADQSAGRWSRTFAVYDNKESLGPLESALRGDSTVADAGWTNLAPRFAKVDFSPPDPNDPNAMRVVIPGPDGGSGGGGQRLSDEDIKKLVQNAGGKGRVMINTEDVAADSPNPPPSGGAAFAVRGAGPGGPGGPGKRVMRRMAMGADGTVSTTTTSTDANGNVSVTQIGPDGKVVAEDQWSRDRLVMNLPLFPRLGDAIPDKATLETADAAAKKVSGRYAIYYTLDKPPTGWMSPGSQAFPQMQANHGTNFNPGTIGNELRNNMGGGIGRLTPEQQVQRARQMREQQTAPK